MDAPGIPLIDSPARYRAALDARWAAALARPPLDQFRSARPVARTELGVSTAPIPSWLRLPVWLHESWCRAPVSEELDSRILNLLWGQYALFLYIRIQDDLLDRHTGDLQLQFVADRFLVESLESLEQARVAGAKSRAFYRTCLRNTVDGILEVRKLEEAPGEFGEHHLPLHARVSGIFKVAAAGVCAIHRRTSDLAWLIQLQDHLAVFSQICDDVQDSQDDLSVGRYTFAGNTLIGARAGESLTSTEALQRLAEGMFDPDRSDRIATALERTAAQARAVVPDDAPEALHRLVDSHQQHAEALRQRAHEARVRWFFGDILTPVDLPAMRIE